MNRPVTMAAKVEAYLSFRRGLGYQLRIEGRLLQQFARYADAAVCRRTWVPVSRSHPGTAA